MSDEVVFYTHPMSRGRIVRWMLEEIGRPYRTELLEYGTTMKSPEYLAINPLGKVPAIRHRDVVVTECGAICAYLADAFPEAGLAPASGDPLRGPYYRWMFFAAGPLETALTVKMLGVEMTPEQKGKAGCGAMTEVMTALETAVAGKGYIVGDSFTAADVYLGSHIGWGMQYGILEKRPAFERYWDRVGARPAARRAEEIDDALMPADAELPSG